jgi:DNA-binding NarL/FixJ family response regulator
VLHRVDLRTAATPDFIKPGGKLTERQVEVVGCWARGMTNRQVGMELCISHQTVKNHGYAIRIKLGARNRTEVVMAAIGAGYIK